MKVLLDEGVPEPLGHKLIGHEVSTVKAQGWRGINNGRLLELIATAAFDTFLTGDKRMASEQRLADRPFAVLILSTCNWPEMSQHVPAILEAIADARPGEVKAVWCGVFVARRFRNR